MASKIASNKKKKAREGKYFFLDTWKKIILYIIGVSDL